AAVPPPAVTHEARKGDGAPAGPQLHRLKRWVRSHGSQLSGGPCERPQTAGDAVRDLGGSADPRGDGARRVRRPARHRQPLRQAKGARTEAELRRIVGDINERIRKAIRTGLSGPPLNLMPYDVERLVSEWRENRR